MSRWVVLLGVWGLTALACDKGGAGERAVLGGLDLDAYCKSTGKARSLWKQDPGQFEGKKTWGCEDASGSWAPLSTGAACTAQYRTTTHGEQERADDPTSWLCVVGPGPANPPPSWNRANL